MAEEQQTNENVGDVTVNDEKVSETEQTETSKPGRKPQVRRTSKPKADAGEEESEAQEDGDENVRTVKEGDDYTVSTEDQGPNKVATETVVEEFTVPHSKRTYRRLVARKGTIVK